MPTDRLPRPRQPRLLLLIGMLVLSFVFTAVLAYQAQGAAELHLKAAKRTLRDYAEIVALEFGINAREGIYTNISSVLFQPADLGVGVTAASRMPPLESPAGHPCPIAPADTAAFFFRLDLKSRTIPVSRGCTSAAVRAWILDTIPLEVRYRYNPTQDFAGVVGQVDGEPRLAAFSVKRDAHDVAVAAFGFVISLRHFSQYIFRDLLAYYPLLPPSLVGKTRNDSLLSVRITDLLGRDLYRSTPQYTSEYTGSVTFNKPSEFGGYIVHATLRPEAAQWLVGGLPPSRLPLLLVMLALSATLVVIAVQVLRREYALARLRSDFISSVSHELRTPLAQVRMFAETLLLSRVRTDAERRRSIEIIDQEARRLTHLVENVLQFSRGERQLTHLSPEPTDIARQVRESIEAFTPIAEARRVAIEPQLIDGVMASVDRAALRQTLLNLLDNAIKYGPAEQTVVVGMTLTGGKVRIWVEDEGPGVMPRERVRIWEPFYRLERDANSAVAGSGIGLAVVREFMEQHRGRVWVENAPIKGARFIMEFPDAWRTVPQAASPAVAAQPSAPVVAPASDTGEESSSSEPTTV